MIHTEIKKLNGQNKVQSNENSTYSIQEGHPSIAKVLCSTTGHEKCLPISHELVHIQSFHEHVI